MTHKKLILTVTAAVVATSFVLTFFFRRPAYETVGIKTGDITEAIYGLGKVKSSQRFEVKLGVISTVHKIYVHEGDAVKAGSPLIEFESRALFRAPFDGTVTLVAVYEGEAALPNVTQLRLENLHGLFIEVSVEQQAALRIRPGQAAKISFESLRGKTLTGKVKSLFSREDEFLTNIDVVGLEPGVLPGMTADVSIEVGNIPNARLIPLTAVHGGMVTVVRNGKREKVKVDIGHVDGLWAEIGSQLFDTDQILVMKATH